MTEKVKRNRRVGSIKNELIEKSRESMLAAVQIFNNPQITFKSELFIVTACIAWTYLLHSYLRSIGEEYRYYEQKGTRRKFQKTKRGAFRHLSLEDCLTHSKCPLDKSSINNLKFLIGIRHEIEHQMTTRIDDALSAKFQACCLNFNRYIKELFDPEYGIDKHLSFSLQFTAIRPDHLEQLNSELTLPNNVSAYISSFEGALDSAQLNDPNFAYRVLFVPKLAKRKGQADLVVEFVKADSDMTQEVNKIYFKESEKPKFLPSEVVKIMGDEGFRKFSMHHHTTLWKSMDAQKASKNYGVRVAKTWYWYQSWVEEVRKHCNENKNLYKNVAGGRS